MLQFRFLLRLFRNILLAVPVHTDVFGKNCIGEDIYVICFLRMLCGPVSSVGMATELRAGRSGYRISARARISAPVQTRPGAHPTSCTMGTGSLSRG